MPIPAPEPEPVDPPQPDPVDPSKSHGEVTLYDLNDKVKALMEEIESLKAAAATEASAALIEDYFTVNKDMITIGAVTNFMLIDPFCIEGPSVLDFTLSASFGIDVSVVSVELMVNSETVAHSTINDSEEPSNLSLIYRGKIEEDS